MAEVQVQDPEVAAAIKATRRANRRRSSRIGKSSAKAIRSLVTKLSSSSVDPSGLRPLVDSASCADQSMSASDDKSDAKSCLSFTDLRPRQPVHADVIEEEPAPAPERRVLRKPSLDLMQKAHLEGLLGYSISSHMDDDLDDDNNDDSITWQEFNVSSSSVTRRTQLRKPSMDLMMKEFSDDEGLFEEEEKDECDFEGHNSGGSWCSLGSSSSRRTGLQLNVNTPLMDLMKLAETEGRLEEESKLDNWDNASAISCNGSSKATFPRSNSMDLMKQVDAEDATDDTGPSECEEQNTVSEDEDEEDQGALASPLQFLPQELNTRLQVSPDNAMGRLPLPERLSGLMPVEPLMETDQEKKASTSEGPFKSKLSSETPRKSYTFNNKDDVPVRSDDVPFVWPSSTLSSLRLPTTTKDDTRRSTRSEASRRSSVKSSSSGSFSKLARKELKKEKSLREMKDSSFRRIGSDETMKSTSTRRSRRSTSTHESMSNDASFRRADSSGRSSKSRRSSLKESQQGSSRRKTITQDAMKDSSNTSFRRRTITHDMKDGSKKKTRRTSTLDRETIKDSSLSRRARRTSSKETKKFSKSRRAAQEMRNSTGSGSGGSRGGSRGRRSSSAKPKESTSGKSLTRRGSHSLHAGGANKEEPSKTLSLRSMSCTRGEESIIPALEVGQMETTSSKRLSQRNPSTKKDKQNKTPRRSKSRDDPEVETSTRKSRRTSFVAPPTEKQVSSHHRRSVSYTPNQRKKMVDLLLLTAPKVAPKPMTPRRKSTDEKRRRQEKGKNSQKRHSTGDKEAPLQLVVESISPDSNHTMLSCEKTPFPAHSIHEESKLTGKVQKEEPWVRTYSTMLRAPKQFKHQKLATRAEFHESFSIMF